LDRRLIRIAAAAATAGVFAWLLRHAGVPTLLWAAGGAVGYAGLLVATGLVDAAALRMLRGRSAP